MLARQFDLTCKCGIARSHLRVVPKKLQYRNVPVGRRRPATFSEYPRGVGIFEPIDDITENIIVLRKKVWPLIIAAAGSSSVGKCFKQIRIRVMPVGSKTARRIIAACSPAKLRQQRHRQKGNSHVVHRLVITTLGSDELADIEHIVERTTSALSQPSGPMLGGGMSFNRGECKGGEGQKTRNVIVITHQRGIFERVVLKHALGRI